MQRFPPENFFLRKRHFVYFYSYIILPVYKLTHDQIELHMSTSITMEDKSSKQSNNMDRDFANEAGSRDSKILVNGLDYDIKGGTQQNSSIILSPLENTINIINDHNSNLHLMPLLYLNTMAGSLVIKIHEINSNASDNKITNDNCKPTETLLGINKRRKLPNNLGYYPKEGIHHVFNNCFTTS